MSEIRDPFGDHLLTPRNAVMAVIDYEPLQFAGVKSMDTDLLLENIVSTVKIAKSSTGGAKRRRSRCTSSLSLRGC